MPIIFYPYEDDLKKETNMTLEEKMEVLLEAAERYKAVVLDTTSDAIGKPGVHLTSPTEVKAAYNWDALAQILREIREMSEGGVSEKHVKADRLLKLAEVYEVLRAAKMQKLEAVRLALVSEANQLRGGTKVVG